MYNVKFARGTQIAYNGLDTKDSGTLYFITDANSPAFYLGDTKLSTVSEVASLILQANATDAAVLKIQNALTGINYTAEENADTVLGVITSYSNAIRDIIGDLDNLTTTAKGSVVGALNELKTAVDNTATDSEVTVTVDNNPTGLLKKYTIRQGTAALGNPDSNIIGVIDIPKDLVVSSGRVVKAEENTTTAGTFEDELGNALPYVNAAGTYIELTIANQTEPIYVNVVNLIDIYTAQQNATQIQVAVVNNVISASIVAGSVDTTELADSSVTTAKIADDNVTKDKLSSGLKSSIDLADSSVQSITEGTTNYTINVDGTDVAVHGLGTAALENSTAFDAAGSAANVLGNTTDTDADITVYGARANTATALNTAKSYTDDALTWGTIGGTSGGTSGT